MPDADTTAAQEHTGNKYLKTIRSRHFGVGMPIEIDVYCVLEAFGVTCPALQHAIKKLLCPGTRKHKDALQDLIDARDAISRAIEMQQQRELNARERQS